MGKKIKKQNSISFEDYLKEQLEDNKIRKYYNNYGKQLEVAYQILKLRKERGISQSELAKKIGTSQSNIARIESGRQNFTISILEKIASALKRNVKIRFR